MNQDYLFGYRPLPDNLTIKESSIDGLGLFAKEDIQEGTVLGISHYIYKKELIRTPLGGFYNCSEDPNVYAHEVHPQLKKHNMNYVELRTLKHIKKGEEITSSYALLVTKGLKSD